MPMVKMADGRIGDVSLIYDRLEEKDYGASGILYQGHIDSFFKDSLETAFRNLWNIHPLGKAKRIFTAGTYVNKPGAHGKGRAFDLDGIEWLLKDNALFKWNAKQYQTPFQRVHYYALYAHFRFFFGTVLGHEYNSAHEDHFHIDDTTPSGYKPLAKSDNTFIQASLFYVHGHQLEIDGVIGPSTRDAWESVMGSQEKIEANFSQYLELTRRKGFLELKKHLTKNLESEETSETESKYKVIKEELDKLQKTLTEAKVSLERIQNLL